MCGFTEICRGVHLLRVPFGGTTSGEILPRQKKLFDRFGRQRCARQFSDSACACRAFASSFGYRLPALHTYAW